MTQATRSKGHQLSRVQKLAWLQLIRCENVGPRTFRELLNHYGSARHALDALPEVCARGGRKSYVPYPQQKAEEELDRVEAGGARLVAMGEADYPPHLIHIDSPPPLLTIHGAPVTHEQKTIAIIGARNCSLSGQKIARKLAGELCEEGYSIVSGLARGIDRAAHQASLHSGTIGVFAGGIDVIYPLENKGLYEDMLANNGCALTEMPLHRKPRAGDFPRRNRLISGISLGVIVVEAALKSGSLHTVRFALEQNREVFAVPGSPLDPRSAGANRLIQQGAMLVTETEDILKTLGPLTSPQLPLREDLDPEQPGFHLTPSNETGPSIQSPCENDRIRVLQALNQTPCELDELHRFTQIPLKNLQFILLEFELAGRLERHRGNQVSLLH
ncbi:DNA-processing protein DprA [Flexibacterium corallicola]|uniref:DNA-processing protein DprA n=1 Tax=Flexibacterium corallicola TaxID=3037259 RepID=UPI00286FAC98|nr:DNA-processing protein DprA [Pseudovibrio sp. M1P-2-3]